MAGPAVTKFYQALLKNLDEAVHESGGVEPLIAEFQADAARFDWPYIPETVEKVTVDLVVNKFIENAIKRGHSLIHKDPVPPTP